MADLGDLPPQRRDSTTDGQAEIVWMDLMRLVSDWAGLSRFDMARKCLQMGKEFAYQVGRADLGERSRTIAGKIDNLEAIAKREREGAAKFKKASISLAIEHGLYQEAVRMGDQPAEVVSEVAMRAQPEMLPKHKERADHLAQVRADLEKRDANFSVVKDPGSY